MHRPEPRTLTGTHCRLEPLECAHGPHLELVAEPAFWDHMGGSPFTTGGFREYIQRAEDDRRIGTRIAFAVIDRATGAAVGVTCFDDIAPEHSRLEIGGTWYARSHWGGVTNPEAKFLLLAHAFEDLAVTRVALKTGHENLRSQSAIERLGAIREGVLRRHMILPNDRPRDTVYYSILADEWPAVRTALLARIADADS